MSIKKPFGLSPLFLWKCQLHYIKWPTWRDDEYKVPNPPFTMMIAASKKYIYQEVSVWGVSSDKWLIKLYIEELEWLWDHLIKYCESRSKFSLWPDMGLFINNGANVWEKLKGIHANWPIIPPMQQHRTIHPLSRDYTDIEKSNSGLQRLLKRT